MKSAPSNSLLIVMAKRPTEGTVKTRLCPPLTPRDAMMLYEAFLRDTIDMVSQASRLAGDVTPAIAYAPEEARDYFRELAPDNFVLLPQVGSDLGERLCNLPYQAQRLGYDMFAMISSDSPTLRPDVPAKCFAYLREPEVDVALGPCEDGGYYLIGMKTPQPALFAGINWSTASVTRDTLEAAEKAGLSVASLSLWYDADTVEDLGRMWADLEGDGTSAPRTHAVLADLLPRALFEIK
ncbi:MAG: TIGR04282 family arsenosugar biosynthesis glycosyltransferase [Chloroflexia bacterium]